jgi:beta-glucosidase
MKTGSVIRTTKFILALPVIISFSCSQQKSFTEHQLTIGFNPRYEPAIDSVLKLMTLEEKVRMVHGNGTFVSAGVERLGIPELKYTDGPTGIRQELERDSWKPLELTTDSITFFPTGTALAATWNEELALRYGKAIGSEANARGKHILLGPGVNIIRTPLCGRNFEYFSEDPYLNSWIAVGYIRGVQSQNVAACVKHYAANNQEFHRWMVNVLMDERTLREIYLPVYKAAVIDGGAYSFMGAYNKFRGNWLCENDYLLNQILKKEWGFRGIVMSDWGATHSTVKAALAGLDVEMGGRLNNHHFSYMADSIEAGLIPEHILDDKVRRILRIIYNCKIMDSTRISGRANTDENSQLAYDVASESIVLLKNDRNLLPLDSKTIKSIAVIGENATHVQSRGGFTADVKARYEISPLEGIQKKIGNIVPVNFAKGYQEKFVFVDTGGFWPYRYPDPSPDPNLIDEAVKQARNSDVAIIFAGTNRNVETEVLDRETLLLPFGQDSLIRAVSSVNSNTIVVVVAGAACDLNVADSCVSSILYAWFNGSEAGNAIADVLFGDINPSGKLPFTIPVKLEDVGAHALKAYPGRNNEVVYEEGILVGYRWFDTHHIRPKYCFGYGLSYTWFEFSGIKASRRSYLPDELIGVSVNIRNIGPVKGRETVQVYIRKKDSEVMRADKELKAFKKIELNPGQEESVILSFNAADLAYYNAEAGKWIVEPGEYQILLGSSSGDIRQESVFKIKYPQKK